MNSQILIDKIQSIDFKKHKARIQLLVKEKPLYVGIGVLVLLLALNWMGILAGKSQTRVIEKIQDSSFQGGRIFGDSSSTYYKGREKQYAMKSQELMERQKLLEDKIKELDQKLSSSVPAQTSVPEGSPIVSQVVQDPANNQVRIHEGMGYEATNTQGNSFGYEAPIPRRRKGSSLISFPVKTEKTTDGVVLPSGSYVKAKMLTGVDVPEGKTYPVLLVLDYSYIAPNESRLDLSGCFMIAKAEGDLSTERVQMQASKLSCVSKKGKMFEREVNGFIADNADGSFAMKGKVNSKQGRVAAMAFMSGVVEGVGKAIQQSQTTQSTNPFGGNSSTMSGDAGKYMVAGGASNAASMVAQWYLQQAQNLSPTVSVDSGKDVWIVMKDKVDLPKEFFRKERSQNEPNSIYSHFSRVID